MKLRNAVARKAALIGSGIGLAMFAVFGLAQGSLIGGAIGLDLINSTMGAAGETLISRIALAASMIAGILVAGIVFVVVFSAAGWLVGYTAGWLAEPKGAPELHAKKHTR
jgi:pheromone shutdown protein TraB